MRTLTVEHTTTYRYATPVVFGEHRLMFRPRDSHDLRLLRTSLETSPPATVRYVHDVLGNSIAIATFSGEASEMRLSSSFVAEHYSLGEDALRLADYAQVYPFSYDAVDIPDLGRTMERHYPDPEHAVDTWARQFLPEHAPMMTRDILLAMNKHIKATLRYEARDAEGTQTPTETLARGAGTCRDFALLMIEAVRSLGFAARFVSGYLYDESLDGGEGEVIGGGATHAWVQIYLPGAGWVEMDPTNDLVGGTNLIRVAVARDPAQAIPVSGTFTGGTGAYLGMEVSVVVRATGGKSGSSSRGVTPARVA